MGIKNVIGYAATGATALVIGMVVSNPPSAAAPTIVTPPACSQAIDQADKGFRLASEAIRAVANSDFATADAANAQMAATAISYNDLKGQCKAAS